LFYIEIYEESCSNLNKICSNVVIATNNIISFVAWPDVQCVQYRFRCQSLHLNHTVCYEKNVPSARSCIILLIDTIHLHEYAWNSTPFIRQQLLLNFWFFITYPWLSWNYVPYNQWQLVYYFSICTMNMVRSHNFSTTV